MIDVMVIVDKIAFILQQLPLPFIFAAILLGFLVVYALTNKILSLVIVGSVQFVLYKTTQSELKVLAMQSATNAKVIAQTFDNIDFIHPLVYMDRALKVATIVPGGLGQTTLIYPIVLSFVIIFAYYIFIFLGKTSSHRAKEFIPILSLLLTFGIFGGGMGMWAFLGSYGFMGLKYNWILIFLFGVYTFLVMKLKRRR